MVITAIFLQRYRFQQCPADGFGVMGEVRKPGTEIPDLCYRSRELVRRQKLGEWFYNMKMTFDVELEALPQEFFKVLQAQARGMQTCRRLETV
jgi:hypothetical protein